MTTAEATKSKTKQSKAIEISSLKEKENLGEVGSFLDFLATGWFTHTLNGFPLLYAKSHDNYLVVMRGEVYYIECDVSGLDQEGISKAFDEAYDECVRNTSAAPAGVLIEMSHLRRLGLAPKGYETYKYFVVCNGDIENSYDSNDADDVSPVDLHDEMNNNEAVSMTVSFRCLGWFVVKNRDASPGLNAAEAITKGVLSLWAFQPDVKMKISTGLAKRIRNLTTQSRGGNKLIIDGAIDEVAKTAKSPAAGFTLMAGNSTKDCYWHRAATVIFWPKNTKTTILVGFDEGSYFGVEVKGRFKSIDDVYAALTPPEAKRLSQPIRQGEWFFIPVAEKNVPPITKCIALYSGSTEINGSNESDDDGKNYHGLAMPVDHEDSSRHCVWSNTEEEEEIRIGPDGKIYVLDPIMEHSRNQHSAVSANGWHTFAKNTALRSFSVTKVD